MPIIELRFLTWFQWLSIPPTKKSDPDKAMDAVVRNFEIIGEAANRIHPDFRDKNPEIEWKRIRGFRNRIVHEYFGIDYEIVWSIIEIYLDDLIVKLESLIEVENKK